MAVVATANWGRVEALVPAQVVFERRVEGSELATWLMAGLVRETSTGQHQVASL